MKKLFKKPTRYSQSKRPFRNDTVIFSPVKELVEGLLVPLKRKVDFLIKPRTLCKVLRNNKYTTTVIIDNKRFIVTPMFLTSENLTAEGHRILDRLKEKSKT